MKAVRQMIVGCAALGMLVAAASPSFARPVDQWSMKVVDGSTSNLADGSAMTFFGTWRNIPGLVGGAVQFRFNGEPSYGVGRGTRRHNPAARNFAFSETFTSKPIPSGYSGNLMQKGYFNDPGQIKLQLVPANGGTVECRIKGTAGARTVHSPVIVDDGRWHTATCFRQSDWVGLTVDAVTKKLHWSPGRISNNRTVRVGNKNDAADESDQHFGALDCSVYTIQGAARRQALARVPC